MRDSIAGLWEENRRKWIVERGVRGARWKGKWRG